MSYGTPSWTAPAAPALSARAGRGFARLRDGALLWPFFRVWNDLPKSRFPKCAAMWYNMRRV